MEVDSDGREEDGSILWLIENAKFLLGPQLVTEIISRINERNEPIFIHAAREPFSPQGKAKNVASRLFRCLDHSQLLSIISTDQFSPSLAWPAIFVLALDRLIAEPNKETAPACRALTPPKQLIYWDTILRKAISRNSASPKAVHLFLKQLTPSALTQLILFALNTTDAQFLLAFNQFYQLVFSETFHIDSFRRHSLVEAIFSRFSVIDGASTVNFDEIFGNTKSKAFCYSGTALLGPPDPAALTQKPDPVRVYDFFFDLLRVNSTSKERLLTLFNKMTLSSATLTSLIKFSIERDSPEHSDDKLLNLIIKSDHSHPVLSDSPSSCLIDRCIVLIDTIIKRFKASFHEGPNSDKGVPIIAQTKFIKAKKLRARLLEASWVQWERSLDANSAKLVDFLGPPWKDTKRKEHLCHAHLAEQTRNYILEKPVTVFKSIDARLHRDHLRQIASNLAYFIGLGQSSIRDVPLVQILMSLEPLSPSGEESNLCALVFAILTSLDHIGSFDPFVPEHLPGLIIYAAQSAGIVASSFPLPAQVISGELPYHPFFKPKLNSLKAMAACAYGFDALCQGPIYSSLLRQGGESLDPPSPNTLAVAQHIPRDAKAFILFWLWLRAGPAPPEIRTQAADWLSSVAFLLNDRFRSSVATSTVLDFSSTIIVELLLTLKTHTQRVWALCSIFDVLDKLASLGCFDGAESAAPPSFIDACCQALHTMWTTLRARILQRKADMNEPIQHHISFVASLLRRVGSHLLDNPAVISLIFGLFQDLVSGICEISSDNIQAMNLNLGYCIAEANIFTETLLKHFMEVPAEADPRGLLNIVSQDVLMSHISCLLRLVEPHEQAAWLDRLLWVALLDGGTRLAAPSDELFETLMGSLPTVLQLPQSLRSPATLPWLKFHEGVIDYPVSNLLFTSESASSAFFSTLIELAVSEDFADEDDIRVGTWRLLKRLIISKDRPWELTSNVLTKYHILVELVINRGVRTSGGTGEGGTTLPVSIEIVSSCLEILQFVCSKDVAMKETILENFGPMLKNINECVVPGPANLLVGLQQDLKAGLKRLLFFVKEILEPDRKKIVQTQTGLHRAIPLFMANILSIPSENMTAEIYKILVHISNRACSYQELVFFLHKFEVHTKLMRTTTAPLNFKIDPPILGAVKAIASKIGDGSRQAPK
eukprot:TRINITY_DN2752_c0_g1_i1.p1 TRINITY_DN2752_c0_g1~~TRINITY_DN2752_c0_g1_i1.p1  ORF type:complete len:1165 (-),score=166.60 TRINITY_DN2752_c0_g1_i1:979-4473(-)